MKRLIIAVLLASLPAPALAQISVPNTFVANTRIVSADVNQNFSDIASKALNREGGTMTGNLTVQNILFGSHNTYDIGVTGTRARDGWFGRNVDIGGTLGVTGLVSFASTSAAAIDVAGGITAGSGNVAIVGTDGRIPAISSTYFADLSGANLTGLLETNIADGSVLARLGANETVTGTYTFTANTVNFESIAPQMYFRETDAGSDEKLWRFVYEGDTMYFQTLTDAGTPTTDIFNVSRTGTTPGALNLAPSDTGVSVGSGTAFKEVLTGTATWDPASVANNGMRSTTITVAGVQATSPCFVGFLPAESSTPANGWTFTAQYSSANTVRVVGVNTTGGTSDLDSATVRVTCFTY